MSGEIMKRRWGGAASAIAVVGATFAVAGHLLFRASPDGGGAPTPQLGSPVADEAWQPGSPEVNVEPGAGRRVFVRVPPKPTRPPVGWRKGAPASPVDPGERIAMVIGSGHASPYAIRAMHLDALGPDLDAGQIGRLCGFLLDRARVPNVLDGQLRALKNDVMGLLLGQAHPAQEFADTLASLIADRGCDPVLRDYAVQHIASWCETRREGREGSRLMGILWAALDEKDGTIAGTALLGLGRMRACGLLAEADCERLKTEVARLCGDGESSPASLSSALQVAADLDLGEIGPRALALAGDEATGRPLRCSAIAALGRIGGAGSESVLKRIAGGPDVRLSEAAREALSRMKKPGLEEVTR